MSKHQFYKCDGSCEERHCKFCDGGLAFCTVCKGAEGDLPIDCPGRPMTEEEAQMVYSGKLDFIGCSWVSL